MNAARTANPLQIKTMYGIVTVGHYSRFYELREEECDPMIYFGYDGSPLHFKHDEQKIDEILCYIVDLIKSDE